jgi:biopolymer transport protein ExbD
VDLAKVNHPIPLPGANREDALRINIQRNGSISLGYERVTLNGFTGRVREGLALGAERKVYIRADARAYYGNVRGVLSAIRAAGVEKVAFLTDERESRHPTTSRLLVDP